MAINANTSPVLKTLQIGAISAGDIVFVYDDSARGLDKIKQLINVTGQRILAAVRKEERLSLQLRTPQYSHVMLGMDGGLIIHADGKKVAIEVISDALTHGTNYDASHFQIYRHNDITKENADQIVKSAMRYYNQEYSFFSYFNNTKVGDTTQFCSRLIAHAYRSVGIPLTSLADNKVLPVDLYLACQSDNWKNVSAEFVQEPPPSNILNEFPPIEISGRGPISLSDFLIITDELVDKSARIDKRIMEEIYANTRKILRNEILLTKCVSALLDVVNLISDEPHWLDEEVAARVVNALKNLKELLAFSLLTKEQFLQVEALYYTNEDQTDISQYAGDPTPLAICEMRVARMKAGFYCDLLLAEIGLLTIDAHRTKDGEFAQFKLVKSKYACDFANAVEPINNLEPYENEESLFEWVECERDRARWRTTFRSIIRVISK